MIRNTISHLSIGMNMKLPRGIWRIKKWVRNEMVPDADLLAAIASDDDDDDMQSVISSDSDCGKSAQKEGWMVVVRKMVGDPFTASLCLLGQNTELRATHQSCSCHVEPSIRRWHSSGQRGCMCPRSWGSKKGSWQSHCRLPLLTSPHRGRTGRKSGQEIGLGKVKDYDGMLGSQRYN